jgi:hypothetical protein
MLKFVMEISDTHTHNLSQKGKHLRISALENAR